MKIIEKLNEKRENSWIIKSFQTVIGLRLLSSLL